MAIGSVTTKQQVHEGAGTTSDLFLQCGAHCVTVTMDRASKAFPPSMESLAAIQDTIKGLGLAVGILGNLVRNEEGDRWNTGCALEAIADSIVLHASLADGIRSEIEREPTVSELAA